MWRRHWDFLENVYSGVPENSGVGTPSDTSVECGVLARSATDDPESYQGIESRPASRNGVPRERGL